MKTCLVGVAAIVLCSCAHDANRVRVDPGSVSQSYDVTKPADISSKSYPCYMLPKISWGWNPAVVNSSGEWVSGHYTATVLQEGHWATQEEAELSGRPYIRAGDSKAIVPTGGTQVSATGSGTGEFDVSALSAEVESMKRNMPAGVIPDKVEDSMVSGALSQLPMVADNPMVSPGVSDVPLESRSRVVMTKAGAKVFVSRKPPGTIEVVPVEGTSDTVKVLHGQNGSVNLVYKGQTIDTQFTDSDREVTFKTDN